MSDPRRTDRRWPLVVAACAALAIAGAWWPAMPWLHWLFKPTTTLIIAWTVWRSRSDLPRYRRWLWFRRLLPSPERSSRPIA